MVQHSAIDHAGLTGVFATKVCRAVSDTSQNISTGTWTALQFDDADTFDPDGLHFTSAANLTGTVSKTASNTTITGSGTSFTTELSVGQVIDIPGTAVDRVIVATITNNTSLTVVTAPANTASGQTATRVNSVIAFMSGDAGYFTVTGRVYFDENNLTGDRYIAIAKGTSPSATATRLDPDVQNNSHSAGGDMSIHTCDEVSVAIGDYLELHTHQDSGGTRTVTFRSFAVGRIGT